MKKVCKIALLIILIAALALALFSCGTTAYWQEQDEDTRDIETDIADVNGSAKHIVYVALDSSGAEIASGSATTAAAYGVVGYTGLVSELVIPATYRDDDIRAAVLPVTKVLFVSSYAAYKCSQNGAAYTGADARLRNNPVVTSIVFGANLNNVLAGTCLGMTNLKKVTFKNTTAVTVGQSAFDACFALESVSFACTSGSVTLNGNFSGLTPTYAS